MVVQFEKIKLAMVDKAVRCNTSQQTLKKKTLD